MLFFSKLRLKIGEAVKITRGALEGEKAIIKDKDDTKDFERYSVVLVRFSKNPNYCDKEYGPYQDRDLIVHSLKEGK